MTNSNKSAKPDTINELWAEEAAKGKPVREIGGFADKKLPEPTRYGDWEVGGRCSDF